MSKSLNRFRLAGAVLAAGAGLLLGSGLATAAPASVPSLAAPSTADVNGAHAAATTPSVQATAGRFLAGAGKAGIAPNATVTPKMGRTVAVYYLNPAFVTATSASVPVATQAFLATEATAPDGTKASVWTARQGNAWVEVNIASGDTEFVYADKANAVSGKAFYEPQIHAWYALSGDKVVALNSDATKAIGAQSVSVAEYQHIVNVRYADKMPNTPYGKNHMIGGINTEPGVAGTPRMIAAAAPAQPAGSDPTLIVVLGTVAGIGVIGGAAFYARKRHA
ncbi:hypothetical protein [Labedaea rhizosphaerae]|uniref:LPXTG-motif cell wall-anchored protein n=1 Tax=Labedaea rhizosphaerae TaxID=598644 RepID=A0A4R6SKD1_LABRH|nr:hypothetical protein [Labedaea rhizosphaerae]TDQ01419.1 hypothetical protein EV186_1021287 [Labedaea rhizosphaerae]